MKKTIVMFGLVCMALFAGQSFAHEDDHGQEKTATLRGEIVDMGCYLGHGAKGADHKSCALRCITGGMPMGLLLDDGTVYLLTMSHSDADPFNSAKEMAAETVEISGPVFERGGISALEVDSISLVDASQASLYTCPMHPDVSHMGPGKCPQCGMNLVLEKSAD